MLSSRLNGLLVFSCAALALLCVSCGPSALNCATDEVICGSVCANLQSDSSNCGECGNDCGQGYICVSGGCVPGSEGCDPDDVEDCYFGAAGTEGVGPCRGGSRTCLATATWGDCVGMVVPTTEICDNNIDDDCNGTPDDDLDADGDGFTPCNGDCCDLVGSGCGNPALVNPGAFEAAGNQIDDDCDGTIDNTVSACDNGLASNSANALDYAMAMDLCQTTTESGASWGVISGEFTLTSGSGTPAADSRSIRPGFGTGTAVQFGTSLAVMSTGHAAASADSNPSFAPFQGGQDMGGSGGVPADWLAANGGDFPNAPGCPEPQGGTTAVDPVMLKLRVRVPTNAQSFSLSSKFFSSEYPEWVCSPYNDFFVVLLDSAFAGAPANPTDKNLAIYTAPDDAEYPVGVNLAHGNTGLFTVCLNGPTGCGGDVAGTSTTCTSTSELTGTGFDIANPDPQFTDDPGWCDESNLTGGATGWLTTSGNVVPGEIIELRFAIWDTGDQWYDSVVLLDNFQWSVEASDPGTVID